MFLTSEGRGRQQNFEQAAPNELKLGEGGKVVRAGHRLGGGIGGREGEGRRITDEAGLHAVELQPDFKTIGVCLVQNKKDIYMITKSLNTQYLRRD